MLLGPMLARFGEAYMPIPGGDKIGRRRLDTHFQGFVELGADFSCNDEEGLYSLKANGLNGKYILLEDAKYVFNINIRRSDDGKTLTFETIKYLEKSVAGYLNKEGLSLTDNYQNRRSIVDRISNCFKCWKQIWGKWYRFKWTWF